MYRVCVPVINKKYDEKSAELLVRELKRVNPDTVYMVFDRVFCNDKILDEITEMFEENVKFLQNNGFKVGAWLAPSIGYGSAHWGENGAKGKFVQIHSIDGKIADGGFCPLDRNFVDEFIKVMLTIARTGVSDILLEDDFTLTGGKAILLGCCCSEHMKRYAELLGEEITVEDLHKKMIDGGRNKYRDVWCELMGKTLCDFASEIEKAVHKENKNIRIGLSANASSYILEGVEISKLAKIIAGDTKPFIRMTGAPYWTNANAPGPNIDAIRVQEFWSGEGIELLTEGDTYPRPRLWVPSAELECYDMILRAEGKSHGILKYMIDYTYNADYETGYVDNHCRNQKHYDELERLFKDKEAVGLNVFEKPLLFADEEFGKEITNLWEYKRREPLPLISQWFLADNSIPTTYGAKDCASIVFGANAHYIDDETLKNGVILDAQAARILTDKGLDTGIKSYKKTSIPMLEHYLAEDEYGSVRIGDKGFFYDFETDEKVEIFSEFIVRDEVGGFANISPYDRSGKRIPACFYYENADGHKFVIYSFVASTVWVKSEWTPGIFRDYHRQKQLVSGIARLQRRRLPAMCEKCPQLYILCKKDNESMTVGLWNLFADTIYSPEIILDGEYKRAEFYNCNGKIEKDKIKLDTDIIPYGFGVITLYK